MRCNQPLLLPLLPSCHCPINVLQVLKTIDVVVDESYTSAMMSYTLKSFKANFKLFSSNYPFLTSGRVYRTDKLLSPQDPKNGSYGTDWFESSLPNADIILQDFAKVLTPSAINSTYETRWLRNLAAGEVPASTSASECHDPSVVCPGETAPSAPPPVYNNCRGKICAPSDRPEQRQTDNQRARQQCSARRPWAPVRVWKYIRRWGTRA